MEHFKPTNREKVLRPKRGKFWCNSCDAELVEGWAKCPKCGKRSGRYRFKK